MLSPFPVFSMAEKRFLSLFLDLASPGLMLIMQTQCRHSSSLLVFYRFWLQLHLQLFYDFLAKNQSHRLLLWSPFPWTFGASAGLLMGSQEALSLDSLLILQLHPSPVTLPHLPMPWGHPLPFVTSSQVKQLDYIF